MRSSNLGVALISVCVTFALLGVLFSSISWVIVSVALTSLYLYARQRFVEDIAKTSLEIERTIPTEMVFAKEAVEVNVEVVNRQDIPVQGTFEDLKPENCNLSGGTNRSTRILPPRSLLSMSYSLIPQKRGLHLIPGLSVERTDALGLFLENQTIEHGTVINAHTDRKSLDAARKMAGREHLEFSGIGRNPTIVLREFEFDGIRDYVPGDRARDIHWKSVSKLNTLMTKTYKKEGVIRTTVFVDCGRSMRFEFGGVSKIDHALNLSMQLSNVLLNSYHPTGVATFDELNVLDKVGPGLGRHQFDRIVKLLRNVPSSVATLPNDQPRSTKNAPANDYEPRAKGEKPNDERSEFLSALGNLPASGATKRLGLSLEGGIKASIAGRRGEVQMFIVITDLESSRDTVIAAAKICQRTGNRMLVIHTYDDWYRKNEMDDLSHFEGLYDNLSNSLKVEGALRGLGARYLRIGPADSAARIARAIRRGAT